MYLNNFAKYLLFFLLLTYSPLAATGNYLFFGTNEEKVQLPNKGIYTSIEEIDKNMPKHILDLHIKKYNSVDVYYIHKAKIKLLKDVLAISDGKDLFVAIGNFRNKKGFVKTDYTNWNLEPNTNNKQLVENFPPGYYRSYNFYRNTFKVDSTVKIKQQGKKAIYQLLDDNREKITGIVAVSDGMNMYIKMGRYHNRPVFAKSVIKGKFYYFETEFSILKEDQMYMAFLGLEGVVYSQLSKEFPLKEKVGVLLNTENQELFILGDYRTSFKKDMFTSLICKYPKLLIEFLRSDRKSLAKKKVITEINSIENGIKN